MRLIVDQTLAAGFIAINTQQQRASLPFKPGQGYLEMWTVYACAGKEGIYQWRYNFPVRAATHYHTWALQTLIFGKECFILLLKAAKIENAFIHILLQ